MNYYEILHVSPLADEKTIRSAYRTLMFKCRCHPDLGGSEETARRINEAYAVLIDAEKRQRYNKTLDPAIFSPKRTSSEPTERRRIPRVSVDFTTTYTVGGQNPKQARILDLSALGCRMQTREIIKKGTRVTININGYLVGGCARWRRMFHPSVFQRVYECGIEFEREFTEIEKIKP